MTGSIGEFTEALAVVMCALVLLTALLAWRIGPVGGPRSVPDVAAEGGWSARLTELRGRLDREFITTSRALAAISPASRAALQTPPAESIKAAVSSTTRYLEALRDSPPDPWQASACYGQGRAIGLCLVQIQDAALSAARHPHDEVMTADLDHALAELDRAVANLQILTASPSENSVT